MKSVRSSSLHRLMALATIAVPALVVGLGWDPSWPPDGVVLRLWGLLVVFVVSAGLMADGFDRRYQDQTLVAAALRTVGVASGLGLVAVLVADRWVHGPTRGLGPVAALVVGLIMLSGATVYRHRSLADDKRHQGAGPTQPAPEPAVARPDRSPNWSPNWTAVVVVAAPLALLYSLVAFLAFVCGSGFWATAIFLVGVSSPAWLGLIERWLGQRWGGFGLAVSVGRLVLVALGVSLGLLVAVQVGGAEECEAFGPRHPGGLVS